MGNDDDRKRDEELGEGTGGIAGVLAGAGIGSAAGPIGTLIGGIAGALGGWWAGRAVADAARTVSHDDERYFRAHYDSLPASDRPADRNYDDVRGAYYLGEIASQNPNFIAREFTEVEPELERGWEATGDTYGRWTAVRGYAAEGYARGRSKLDDAAARAKEKRDRTSQADAVDNGRSSA